MLSISLPTLAETDSEILSRIAENSRKIQSISCRFEQTKHIKALKNDVQMSGNFYFQSLDRVCMQYSSPQGDLLLMNGNDFVMISGGKRSATNVQNNPSVRQMQNLLIACIKVNFDKLPLGKGGKIVTETTEKLYKITLLFEGTTKRYFSSVVLEVDRNDLSLNVLRMNEPNGNFTEYRFSQKQFNTKIAENVFDVTRR